MDRAHLTSRVKALAKEHGFKGVGIAQAQFMEEEAKRLEEWLSRGHQGRMEYMERHFDLRTDPTKLVPGARSVISLSFNYYTPIRQSDPDAPKFSRYAYGRDYHKVLRKKLKKLITALREEIGDFAGRCFVDSAPVLERDWARRSGLGWIGKNTMLINPKLGSYYFLAEIICDLDLEYDTPVRDYCGTCTRCIDACPTNAISNDGYILEARKCISYLTIELRDAIPQEFEGKMENWAFGCDICQEVCPWNRFATLHSEPAFEPKEEFLGMNRDDWEEITEEVFERVFEGSAVRRTKYEGLKRNIKFLDSAGQPDHYE